jgi:hypothetical protein
MAQSETDGGLVENGTVKGALPCQLRTEYFSGSADAEPSNEIRGQAGKGVIATERH